MSKRDYRSYGILADEITDQVTNEIRQSNKKSINLEKNTDHFQQENVIVQHNEIEQSEKQAVDVAQELLDKNDESIDNVPNVQVIDEAQAVSEVQSVYENEQINNEQSIDQHKDEINEKSKHSSIEKTVPTTLNLVKVTDKMEEETESNQDLDTSFENYKYQNPLKKRSGVIKWSIRLIKLAIFIMLLPIIAVVLAVVGSIVAVVAAGIITCFATGICILGGICFMSSQVSGSLVALGVMVAIACLSLGGIISILSLLVIKGLIGLIHKYRVNKKAKRRGDQ